MGDSTAGPASPQSRQGARAPCTPKKGLSDQELKSPHHPNACVVVLTVVGLEATGEALEPGVAATPLPGGPVGAGRETSNDTTLYIHLVQLILTW